MMVVMMMMMIIKRPATWLQNIYVKVFQHWWIGVRNSRHQVKKSQLQPPQKVSAVTVVLVKGKGKSDRKSSTLTTRLSRHPNEWYSNDIEALVAVVVVLAAAVIVAVLTVSWTVRLQLQPNLLVVSWSTYWEPFSTYRAYHIRHMYNNDTHLPDKKDKQIVLANLIQGSILPFFTFHHNNLQSVAYTAIKTVLHYAVNKISD